MHVYYIHMHNMHVRVRPQVLGALAADGRQGARHELRCAPLLRAWPAVLQLALVRSSELQLATVDCRLRLSPTILTCGGPITLNPNLNTDLSPSHPPLASSFPSSLGLVLPIVPCRYRSWWSWYYWIHPERGVPFLHGLPGGFQVADNLRKVCAHAHALHA